jgi:hypothetical protein
MRPTQRGIAALLSVYVAAALGPHTLDETRALGDRHDRLLKETRP